MCTLVFIRLYVLDLVHVCIIFFKRESVQPGCILGLCGSGVPPYEFLNLYGVFNSRFSNSFFKKRLDLKSFKGEMKAEELGDRVPELLSLRVSIKAL